ncbi:MAG TPA: hypothetical protein VF613_19820 [Longimicrobium sp.]|jgi:IS5 family transposase
MLAIQRARTKEKRVPLYRDLLKVAGKVLGYARASRDVLADSAEEGLRRLAFELNRHRLLLERVVDQTERRVLKGESVPAGEKVVSIFETHTDVIVKDGRDRARLWTRAGGPLDTTDSNKLEPAASARPPKRDEAEYNGWGRR